MRCHKCIALATRGYEYPEEFCLAGVPKEKIFEFKNGDLGCMLSESRIKSKIKKNDKIKLKEWKEK